MEVKEWKAILTDSGKTNRELIEIRISGELGMTVAYVPWPNKQDAVLIEKSVNCHNELVSLLSELYENVDWEPGDDMPKRVRKALAKAEGK